MEQKLFSTLILFFFFFVVSISTQTIEEGSTDARPEEEAAKKDPLEEANKTPERVTVIAPKYLKPHSDYHVLVNLANSLVQASVELQLTGARDSNREKTDAKSILINSGETQTVKFTIGDWSPSEYTLSVQVQAIDRSWNFSQEAVLSYQAKSYSAFIQTDKAIYKPGQLVQFRALFLTQTLTPLNLKNEINVTVSDPKRNIIKQWTGLSNYRGLLSLNLPLSEDPMLGDYTIKLEARDEINEKQFRVAEYILPSFGVDISLPSYTTYNDSDLVATVSASYTYGKPVNGHVALTVQPLVRFSNFETEPLLQSQYRARLVNGSAEINLDLVKDLKLERELFEREIEFFALVEEDLTGRKYNKTKTIKIHDKHEKVELINGKESFKPGLAHTMRFKVAYKDDTPVEDNGPELEVRVELLGRVLEVAKLRPVGGIAEHTIRIPKREELSGSTERYGLLYGVEVEATYRGHKHYLGSLLASKSKSDQYMQIQLPQLTQQQNNNNNKRFRKPIVAEPAINANENLKVKLVATEAMQQVTCQGISRGDLVWALSPDAKNQTEFEFEVKIDQRMAPEMKVLCFYIRDENKELIADLKAVKVSGLIRNSVRIETSKTEAKPAQEVQVDVLTKPNSLVGILGIDQSVLLLKSGNDISSEDVSNDLRKYGPTKGAEETNVFTRELFDSSEVIVLTNNYVYSPPEILPITFNSDKLDKSSKIRFGSSSRVVLDSLVLDHDINPPEFHLNKLKSDETVIRSFFPETWLWENATAGSDGLAQFKRKVPDSITSWVLSAFSISESAGLGLSGSKTSLRVFRPFFIKLNLPYSIIRGEIVNIQAVIFNYSKKPTSARVTLENQKGEYEFVEAANSIEDEKMSPEMSETRLISIPAEDGVSVSFLIRPKRLGSIDIKMSAQSEFAGDGVVEKLLVKAEGQTQYLNKAMLINLEGPQSSISKNITIDVPLNAVPDSQKVFVSAVGDIMGKGLSNVDDLLRLPYGCGEQNMINLVPNIVIYNYLKISKRLKEAQRNRAIRNVETGYQRQLNYKRRDGSFSAFGESDTNGSVWLTAYVLKTLQQAKSMITVDEKVIRRAANFISSQARSDGSIKEVGMLHNKDLQSQGSSERSIYLTAYSMIALLQRPIETDPENLAPVALDEVLEKGLNFLENSLEEAAKKENPYDLIIITYALHLANRRAAMDKAWEEVGQKRQENGEFVWWENKQQTVNDSEASKLREAGSNNEGSLESEFDTVESKSTTTVQPPPLKPVPVNTKHSAHLFIPNSLSIEMTALALLTTVRRGDLERAIPIVKWLIAQQNSNGGFASTQDTVLAIEALANFANANAARESPLSIDLEILYPKIRNNSRSELRRNNVEQLLISNTNALVNQQLRLADNSSWVRIKATGSGSAVIQVSWQYNLLVSAEKPAFYLNPIVDKTSNINYLQLSICTFYKAGEASNMAVMEVDLPSGYEADVEALPGLTRSRDVKRVDTAERATKVFIYLDKVTRDEICLTVPAHRTSKVSNNKPVPVSIYDYYNRQHAARIFYEPQAANSCDICDTDTCSQSCSTKPKKSERLVSLHEQRRIKLQQAKKNENLIAAPDNRTSTNSNSSAYQILPLAPVVMTIVAAAKNLY